jgi:hypothetical protein
MFVLIGARDVPPSQWCASIGVYSESSSNLEYRKRRNKKCDISHFRCLSEYAWEYEIVFGMRGGEGRYEAASGVREGAGFAWECDKAPGMRRGAIFAGIWCTESAFTNDHLDASLTLRNVGKNGADVNKNSVVIQ